MRMMRNAIMATIAKKVFDEARKPHNQQKIKEFVASLSNKSSRGGGTYRGGSTYRGTRSH